MKKILSFSLFFFWFSILLHAQTFTLSGYIQDSATGEKLIGANIFSVKSLQGTTTNTYGFYSITLPQGVYGITFSFIGYQSQTKKIQLNKDRSLNINLAPSINLSQVEVTADKMDHEVKSSQMSSVNLSVKKISKLPALLGEVDVIKTLQLLPGVQSGTEGSSGLYVRGGGPDQNLILLDGTPVYNVSHLFGFFSVFNVDAIRNINLIKGGFPARYGGRLSSVLDISLKEGNMKKMKGSGSIGIISAKMTLEGPIVKDKTSFIISARRTYLDALIQPFLRSVNNDENAQQGYYFYDLNAKINHKFSDKDRLYLSAYMGQDKFYNNVKPYEYLYDGTVYTEESKAGLQWGNIISALRWNHQWNKKLFSNTAITYSNYDFDVHQFQQKITKSDSGTNTEMNSLKYFSGIEDVLAKVDFDFLPNPNHYIRFGVSNIYHTFKPGISVYKIQSAMQGAMDTLTGAKKIYGNEYALYLEDDYKISANLKANVGIRYSGFYVNGKLYHSLQPRLSVRYLLNETTSLKASYARMQQYIHLLTNNTIGLPTDLWVPATDKVAPEQSQQVALGISKTFANKYQLSVEGYYKIMNGIIEYKDGASFMGSSVGWEDKVESGKGWSYGGEVFFEKKFGTFTGWIGYTLSWTNRQFKNINGGRVFPYKYDRRHDISIVMMVPLGKKWNFSATWVYGTGTAHTLPTERYFGDITSFSPYEGNFGANGGPFSGELEHVGERNSIRAAAYHRLDLGFQKTSKKKWGELLFNFGLYNAYNHKNPFYYYIGYDSRGNRALRRVTLFPLIPSFSMGFKF